MNYHKVLQRTMEEERQEGRYSHLTDAQLHHAIAEIGERLRGPMPNGERIFDAAVRRGMQAELARRTSEAFK
jgi:hypothetical protein